MDNKYISTEFLNKYYNLRTEILKSVYNAGYEYIARDECGKLFVYAEKPRRLSSVWLSGCTKFNTLEYVAYREANLWSIKDLFEDIKWTDKEPFDIAKELDNETQPIILEGFEEDLAGALATVKEEPLKHDDHYKALGIEPWDILEANMTHEEFKGFLKGNIQKYLHRNKEGLKDYEKLLNYAQKLVEVEKKHGNDNKNNNDK
ncbi:DUF3310 domain-containing protein [uncultured Veillonella sp.]|uniref:DUF3310 domain-containing protein n=1 Tax=uncultured Veillonella sp. TaxID=159268 RepID=UPI0025D4D21B|nr:DUF3310 domain-containing protein [uncultured Veillonella sp.]